MFEGVSLFVAAPDPHLTFVVDSTGHMSFLGRPFGSKAAPRAPTLSSTQHLPSVNVVLLLSLPPLPDPLSSARHGIVSAAGSLR